MNRMRDNDTTYVFYRMNICRRYFIIFFLLLHLSGVGGSISQGLFIYFNKRGTYVYYIWTSLPLHLPCHISFQTQRGHDFLSLSICIDSAQAWPMLNEPRVQGGLYRPSLLLTKKTGAGLIAHICHLTVPPDLNLKTNLVADHDLGPSKSP